MRAFITLSRRSAVTISRRRESMVRLGSAAVACSTWLRVSTSSPTRFIMRLSSVTSTRNVLSAAVPAPVTPRGRPISPAAAWVSGAGATAGSCADAAGSAAYAEGRASGAAEIAGADESASAGGGEPAIERAFGLTCAAACGWISPGLAACKFSRQPIRGPSSPLPSVASVSIVFRIERRPSSSCSRPVIIGRLAASLPSRNRPSRFSPACASFSRRLKPRNPVVPLMVCTERNISASKAALSGFSSRSVRHRSMRSRPSWLSIRNSLVSSSIAPTQSVIHRVHSAGRTGRNVPAQPHPISLSVGRGAT